MSTSLDKLNLRPGERRLLVFVALVVFVVVNVWWVWPRFKDWTVVKARVGEAETKLALYRKEIATIPGEQAKLQELEKGGGGVTVLSDDQKIHFRRTVQSMAGAGNIVLQDLGNAQSSGGRLGAGNQFFEELSLAIRVLAGERDLIQFLYRISSENSGIRVRDISLNPGPTGTNLAAQITLMASYQKAAPAKPAAATPKKP
jgi:hypothetical protein